MLGATVQTGTRWAAVVLAAGYGKRLRSRIPKVLHEVGGRPLLDWVLDRALEVADPDRVVAVIGHGREDVAPLVERRGAWSAVQDPPRGTGDAARVGLERLPETGVDAVLVLCGDVPLLRPETVACLCRRLDDGAAAVVLTATLDEPGAYGRIVRAEDGTIRRIVEAGDADDEQLAIREVNTGIYAFRRDGLDEVLDGLRPDNAQAEYYLTDVVEALLPEGVEALEIVDPSEMSGVNSRGDLARVARVLNERVVREWMAAGVTVVDPGTTWIEPGCRLGPDVVLEPGVVVRGGSRIGTGARVGAHSVVDGRRIPDGAVLPPLTRLDGGG